MISLLGTGLRFGEFAGLHAYRVHLDRDPPVLQVADVAYDAGQFGKGIKPRPKSAAGFRPIPLPRQVVAAVRRQLPVDAPGRTLVFTGPGGGYGVRRGERTRLSRGTFERTYHRAVTRLTNPAVAPQRPTATRVARALRAEGAGTVAELSGRLAIGGRALRPASVQAALGELAAAGLAQADRNADDPAAIWEAVRPASSPVLDDLELHGPHDFRHTDATWLEDAGIPSRVIDELMGHGGRRDGPERGSTVGRRYRWTTPEMAAHVVAAIEARLEVVLAVAAQVLPDGDKPDPASDAGDYGMSSDQGERFVDRAGNDASRTPLVTNPRSRSWSSTPRSDGTATVMLSAGTPGNRPTD